MNIDIKWQKEYIKKLNAFANEHNITTFSEYINETTDLNTSSNWYDIYDRTYGIENNNWYLAKDFYNKSNYDYYKITPYGKLITMDAVDIEDSFRKETSDCDYDADFASWRNKNDIFTKDELEELMFSENPYYGKPEVINAIIELKNGYLEENIIYELNSDKSGFNIVSWENLPVVDYYHDVIDNKDQKTISEFIEEWKSLINLMYNNIETPNPEKNKEKNASQ